MSILALKKNPTFKTASGVKSCGLCQDHFTTFMLCVSKKHGPLHQRHHCHGCWTSMSYQGRLATDLWHKSTCFHFSKLQANSNARVDPSGFPAQQESFAAGKEPHWSHVVHQPFGVPKADLNSDDFFHKAQFGPKKSIDSIYMYVC